MEFKVSVDTAKNRLFVKLDGFPSMEDVKAFEKALFAELTRIKPGFTLLNDAAAFKPAGADVQAEIAVVMKKVAEKKPSKVARVVTSVAGMQLGRISKEAGYEASTFANAAEAEKFLDS